MMTSTRPTVHYTGSGAILRIYGNPAPKGSKSVWRGRVVDDAKDHVVWKRAIADVAEEWRLRRLPMLDGPLVASAVFFLPKPPTTRFKSAPIGPPDLSKLIRAVEDPLNGIVWRDDARIVVWTRTSKVWADGKEPPGVLLEVFPHSL